MHQGRESVDVDVDNIEELVEYLRDTVPHIDWDYQYHDHDSGIYSLLTVPVGQLTEAEEIIHAYQEGLDLEDYNRYERYKGLYSFDSNTNKYIVNDTITTFAKIASDFCSYIERVVEINLHDSLKQLELELSRIIYHAYHLPDSSFVDVSYIPSYEHPPQGEFIFGDLSFFDRMPEYYTGSKADVVKVSQILVTIYMDFSFSLAYYEMGKDSDDYLAAALWHWSKGFRKENGWGDESLLALELIRTIVRKL